MGFVDQNFVSEGPNGPGGSGGGGAVDSVFGRTGVVVAAGGDYTASQVTNVPAGNITATDVQSALNELDTNISAVTSGAYQVFTATAGQTVFNTSFNVSDEVLAVVGGVVQGTGFSKTGAQQVTFTTGIAENEEVIIINIGASNSTAGDTKRIETITATDTLTVSDDTILADATGGAIVVNLPAAGDRQGKVFTVKKIDATANTVTIDPNGAETVDGAATSVISAQYTSVTIQSDGANWFII